MEDLSCLWDDSQLENEFINFVRHKYSQTTFESSAKIMLGDDWQETGTEIIEEFAPELKPIFERYVSHSQQA